MYRPCPNCQSKKIMPLVSNDPTAIRPNVPKSLMLFLPSVFILLFLGIFSLIKIAMGSSIGSTLQGLILAVFLLTTVSLIFLIRDMPTFKLSLQAYLQAQKRWKCRDCHTEWDL